MQHDLLLSKEYIYIYVNNWSRTCNPKIQTAYHLVFWKWAENNFLSSAVWDLLGLQFVAGRKPLSLTRLRPGGLKHSVLRCQNDDLVVTAGDGNSRIWPAPMPERICRIRYSDSVWGSVLISEDASLSSFPGAGYMRHGDALWILGGHIWSSSTSH